MLNNLGHALWSRASHRPDGPDLDDALTAFELAADRIPATSPDIAIYLDNLANALTDRYAREGSVADLDLAIAYHEKAATGPVGGAERTRLRAGQLPTVS